MAVSRCSCSLEAVEGRRKNRVEPDQLRGRELWLDGYNIITLLETALAGGVVLLARDSCFRDIAGIHRRYRKVEETSPALRLIGETTASLGVSCCRWWLDKPVSNSGRLKTVIREIAASAGWNMPVELVFSPDGVLARTPEIVATSDGIVLDRCQHWVNLTAFIIRERIPKAQPLDLSA